MASGTTLVLYYDINDFQNADGSWGDYAVPTSDPQSTSVKIAAFSVPLYSDTTKTAHRGTIYWDTVSKVRGTNSIDVSEQITIRTGKRAKNGIIVYNSATGWYVEGEVYNTKLVGGSNAPDYAGTKKSPYTDLTIVKQSTGFRKCTLTVA